MQAKKLKRGDLIRDPAGNPRKVIKVDTLDFRSKHILVYLDGDDTPVAMPPKSNIPYLGNIPLCQYPGCDVATVNAKHTYCDQHEQK